jgi:Uma2 family endonuclease
MTTPVKTLVPSGATPHRIDFATFVRLGELGIYPTRSELIDGIVYDMSPKGNAHDLARSEIVEQLVLAGRGRYRVGAEPTLKVNDRNGPMPDVLVTPRNAPIAPERAELVLEVADSSLDYDRTGRRALYATAAVPEYWVVDLQNVLLERYLPTAAETPVIFRAGDSPAPKAYPDVVIDLESVFAAAREGRQPR